MRAGDDSVDRIVGETIAFIRRRGYVPGERLPSERDLAERFSASRGAVREALVKLETMRMLERRPNSGLFLGRVPDGTSLEALVLSHDLGLPIDETELAESMEVRRMLEVQAIRLACERRAEADLATMDGILAASAEAIGDGRPLADLDYRFHLAIFRATQNDILVRLVNPFYLFSRSRRAAFFSDPDRGRTSHAQHVGLVAAIRGRDAEASAARMFDHIGRVEQHFRKAGTETTD